MHAEESAWLATATETDLTRMLEDARIPGGRCSVAEAFVAGVPALAWASGAGGEDTAAPRRRAAADGLCSVARDRSRAQRFGVTR